MALWWLDESPAKRISPDTFPTIRVSQVLKVLCSGSGKVASGSAWSNFVFYDEKNLSDMMARSRVSGAGQTAMQNLVARI